MTVPITKYLIFVDVTLASLADGSTTTYRLSQSEITGEQSSIQAYHPIVKSVSSFGVEMGEFLPAESTASITIDNSYNSFGANRRFFDLFERETPINQAIAIYVADIGAEDQAPNADAVKYWEGSILRFSATEEVLRLEATVDFLRRDVITRSIKGDTFSSLADKARQSRGKYLPIVFGSAVEVKPLVLDSEGVYNANNGVSWAYATTFADDYVTGGIQNIYVRDQNGFYREFDSPASVTTGVMSTLGTTSSNTGQVASEAATLINFTAGTDKYLITGGKAKMVGGFGPFAGTGGLGTFKIYARDGVTGAPKDTALATATFDKDDYSAQYTSGASFTVEFTFDKPVIINNESGYYIAYSQGNATGGSCLAVTLLSGGASGPLYFRGSPTNTASASTSWQLFATAEPFQFEFYGAVLTDPHGGAVAASYWPDESGLGMAAFELRQNAPATNQVLCPLHSLDLVVATDGLESTPGSTILSPKDAIGVLDKRWNGSAWAAQSDFDFTPFLSTHAGYAAGDSWHRGIAGSTQGRQSRRDVLERILRDTFGRVGLLNVLASEKLGLWAYGKREEASLRITESDAKIVSIRYGSLENIVNKINILYNRGYVGASFDTSVSENDLQDFQSIHIASADSDTEGTKLASLSTDIYGERELREERAVFISDALSAANLGRFFLTRYGNPQITVELELPFGEWNDRFDMLEIIDINHTGLPAYFGTTNTALDETYQGTRIPANIQGHYERRAKTYRAQVEGKKVDFDDSGRPVLLVKIRLLTNEMEPT